MLLNADMLLDAVAETVTVTLPYFLGRAVRMLDALNIWSKLFEMHGDHVHSIKEEAEQRSQDEGGAHAWADQG
jgi:hypothetical protein